MAKDEEEAFRQYMDKIGENRDGTSAGRRCSDVSTACWNVSRCCRLQPQGISLVHPKRASKSADRLG